MTFSILLQYIFYLITICTLTRVLYTQVPLPRYKKWIPFLIERINQQTNQQLFVSLILHFKHLGRVCLDWKRRSKDPLAHTVILKLNKFPENQKLNVVVCAQFYSIALWGGISVPSAGKITIVEEPSSLLHNPNTARSGEEAPVRLLTCNLQPTKQLRARIQPPPWQRIHCLHPSNAGYERRSLGFTPRSREIEWISCRGSAHCFHCLKTSRQPHSMSLGSGHMSRKKVETVFWGTLHTLSSVKWDHFGLFSPNKDNHKGENWLSTLSFLQPNRKSQWLHSQCKQLIWHIWV